MRLLLRSILCAALFFSILGAAPEGLQITNPTISRSDDGVSEPAGSVHIGGDILFFSCRVANYTKSPEQKVHLSYVVQAFDAKGVPIVEEVKNEVSEEVSPQDKEWLPRIATEIPIPPAVFGGKFKISVKVDDLIAKTSTSLDVPFTVRGHAIEPTEKLAVQNMRYYRAEEDTKPMDKPVYKAGDALWFRFDVTGFKYGKGNMVDLSYTFSVLGADGNALWTSPEPIVDQGESFYPKPFVSGAFSIKVQAAVQPGNYFIGVKATDAVGKQVVEAKQPFTVQ